VLTSLPSLFNEWGESVYGKPVLARYKRYIYADTETIDSVITGDPPKPPGTPVVKRTRPEQIAFVKVVDSADEMEIEQLGPDDIDDPELLRKHNEGDEGYPPIDGSKRHDVGWMKAAACKLIPKTYHILTAHEWEDAYVRHPDIKMN
jgi:hypothetical protein